MSWWLRPLAALGWPMERLGFTLIPINGEESDHLGHDAEPRPRNANQVAALMRVVRADVGFVSSSDMGRLSLVSETGETASEEYTFPLIASHVLARKSGTLVIHYYSDEELNTLVDRLLNDNFDN
jgi:phosphomannomutase